MIDLIHLATLRFQADEVRSDLAARQRRQHQLEDAKFAAEFDDQLQDDHEVARDDAIAADRSSMPLVFKRHDGKQLPLDNGNNGNAAPMPLTDDLVEILANVLAQMRMDLAAQIEDATASLRERVAVLEGKIEMILTLFIANNNNSGNSKSIEASEIVRKVRMPSN
jgi:hypothetical protein